MIAQKSFTGSLKGGFPLRRNNKEKEVNKVTSNSRNFVLIIKFSRKFWNARAKFETCHLFYPKSFDAVSKSNHNKNNLIKILDNFEFTEKYQCFQTI